MDMRFRLCKKSGVWLLMGVDPVAGYIPIAFSESWSQLAQLASIVSVNYALARIERAESAR